MIGHSLERTQSMNQTDDRPSEGDLLRSLAGGGEMGERTRAFDWSGTPVGPVSGWPQSLRTAVRSHAGQRHADLRARTALDRQPGRPEEPRVVL